MTVMYCGHMYPPLPLLTSILLILFLFPRQSLIYFHVFFILRPSEFNWVGLHGKGLFIGQEDLPSLDITEEDGSPSPATSRIPSGRD